MKFQVKIYGCLLIALFFVAWSNHPTTKEELFTVLPDNTVQLNEIQSERMAKIQRGGYAEKTVFVKVGNLSDIQKGGKLSITIPIANTQHVFHAYNVKDYGENRYSWTGKTKNTELNGRLSIHYTEGKTFGDIEVGDTAFRLIDLSGGIGVLIKIKEEGEADGVGCGNARQNIKFKESGSKLSLEKNNSTCYVSVLFLYTDAAAKEGPDLSQLAYSAIQDANEALENSAVFSTDLRFKSVGLASIDMEESSFIEYDLQVAIMGYSTQNSEYLTDPNSPVINTQANTLRDEHGADAVIVFTGGTYKDTEDETVHGQAGISVTLGGTPVPQAAFGIVSVHSAMNCKRKTFTHEIGHIMGLLHQSRMFYGRGYEFQAGGVFGKKKRRTLMHTLEKKQNRIHHYSNPDVNFEGEPTGLISANITDGYDSAERLEQTGCVVADFREDLPATLSIGVTFSPCCSFFVNPGDTRIYTANIDNNTGQSPYQYEWRTSSDGFNYGAVLSTTDQMTQDYTGFQAGNILYINIIATSADGITGENFFFQEVF